MYLGSAYTNTLYTQYANPRNSEFLSSAHSWVNKRVTATSLCILVLLVHELHNTTQLTYRLRRRWATTLF